MLSEGEIKYQEHIKNNPLIRPITIESLPMNIFSKESYALHLKKVRAHLEGKTTIRVLDDYNYNKFYFNLVSVFLFENGRWIKEENNEIYAKGNLEFEKTNTSHVSYGDHLTKFTLNLPFSNEKTIYLYAEKNKIKEAGITGIFRITKLLDDGACFSAKILDLEKININEKIPVLEQDIRDFDMSLRHVGFNMQTIKLGNSVEISGLQKLWMPLINSSSQIGHVSGINSYAILTHHGSYDIESLRKVFSMVQPETNTHGNRRLSEINFNIIKKEQTYAFQNFNERLLLKSKYPGGYRANIGTIIAGRKQETTIINQMLHSNIDYPHVLEDIQTPSHFERHLTKDGFIIPSLKYHLNTLKCLPVKYKLEDIKDVDGRTLRIATSFAKLIPNMIKKDDSDLIHPSILKDKYFRAGRKFIISNTKEVNDFLKDRKVTLTGRSKEVIYDPKYFNEYYNSNSKRFER